MNQTNKRKVLAYKENGLIIFCPICFIIFFGIMTFALSNDKLYIQLIGFIVGILGIIITIIMFIKYIETPNIVVECDDSGVYLHYSKKMRKQLENILITFLKIMNLIITTTRKKCVLME